MYLFITHTLQTEQKSQDYSGTDIFVTNNLHQYRMYKGPKKFSNVYLKVIKKKKHLVHSTIFAEL